MRSIVNKSLQIVPCAHLKLPVELDGFPDVGICRHIRQRGPRLKKNNKKFPSAVSGAVIFNIN